MYKLPLILLTVIMLGCGNIHNIRTAEPAAEKAGTDKLTFMTFNIRAEGGTQNLGMGEYDIIATKEHLTKVAAVIKSVDPDFVGLQEVRGIYQAKFIAEKLNLNYTYAVHARENWWGLAFFSKYKIVDVRTKIVNLGGKDGDRIALVCTMEINGKNLRVVTVDFVPYNYIGQVEEVLPLVSGLEGPAILLGDFSRRPEYAEMKPIRERMMAACEAVKNYEGRCIDPVYGKNDYIFVDPNNAKVLNAGRKSIEYGDSSDQTAYWATIKNP